MDMWGVTSQSYNVTLITLKQKGSEKREEGRLSKMVRDQLTSATSNEWFGDVEPLSNGSFKDE